MPEKDLAFILQVMGNWEGWWAVLPLLPFFSHLSFPALPSGDGAPANARE